MAANLTLLATFAQRRRCSGGRECVLCDMDLAAFNALGRRLGIVADGLTLWRGAQLAVDTTMVSPLRRDRSPKPRAANHDGAALEAARRKKENTYPELVGEGGRARLVVLATEVGGRWNVETAQFLTASAGAGDTGHARSGRGRVGQTVERHPRLYCCKCLHRVFARPPVGTGEPIPSVHEVHEGGPVSLSGLTGCSSACVFVWNGPFSRTDASCGATRVGTDHFYERIHRVAAAEDAVIAAVQNRDECTKALAEGERRRIIAVAGEEFCRTCPRRRGRVGPASSASGKAPRIGESS